MRTTLTIDPDIAVILKQTAKKTERPLKQIVNDALRRGLAILDAQKPARPFKTKPFKGTRLLMDVTSTSRALAEAEGENHK